MLSPNLKNCLNSRLQRIANMLLLNGSFINNLGLLNGKMGIAIFFYQYSRFTNNKVYLDFAGQLIDEIYEEIYYGMSADFANGLTGIGWGIEYLIKNGFVEADRDETLKEIDNGVFGASLGMPVMISDQNDILGFGLYYLTRLYGREHIEDEINILHLKQILIYLVDDCERLLVHKKFLDVNIPFLNAAQLNSIIYYLLEIHRLELFPVKVEKLFHHLPSHIEALADKNDDWAFNSSTYINAMGTCRRDFCDVSWK